MKYKIEYNSAIDGLTHEIEIKGTSEADVTKKLVDKYGKKPSKILSCRRVEDMKSYKIGNRVIQADSVFNALKIHKMLDSQIKDDNSKKIENQIKNYLVHMRSNYVLSDYDKEEVLSVARRLGYNLRAGEKLSNGMTRYYKDSIEDDEIIGALSEEERQAIEDYRKAIAGTNDPKMLQLYAHILKEEVEHLEELKNAENGDFVEDENKDPKEGTRFMMRGSNKEYIITHTNANKGHHHKEESADPKDNDHEFEYAELLSNGNTINPRTMEYREFQRRSDIHII